MSSSLTVRRSRSRFGLLEGRVICGGGAFFAVVLAAVLMTLFGAVRADVLGAGRLDGFCLVVLADLFAVLADRVAVLADRFAVLADRFAALPARLAAELDRFAVFAGRFEALAERFDERFDALADRFDALAAFTALFDAFVAVDAFARFFLAIGEPFRPSTALRTP